MICWSKVIHWDKMPQHPQSCSLLFIEKMRLQLSIKDKQNYKHSRLSSRRVELPASPSTKIATESSSSLFPVHNEWWIKLFRISYQSIDLQDLKRGVWCYPLTWMQLVQLYSFESNNLCHKKQSFYVDQTVNAFPSNNQVQDFLGLCLL